MTKQKIRYSINAAFSSLVIIVVAIIVLLLQNKAGQWVTHSTNVKIQVNDVYTHFLAAESSLRGYLLTNDTHYLGDFRVVHGLV